MVVGFKYYPETRSFGIMDYARSKSGRNLTSTLALAGAGIGVASGIAGLTKQLRDSRFEVVWLTESGTPSHKAIRAVSPMDAVSKVQRSTKGSKFKAFELPAGNEASQEYFNSLK